MHSRPKPCRSQFTKKGFSLHSFFGTCMLLHFFFFWSLSIFFSKHSCIPTPDWLILPFFIIPYTTFCVVSAISFSIFFVFKFLKGYKSEYFYFLTFLTQTSQIKACFHPIVLNEEFFKLELCHHGVSNSEIRIGLQGS